MMSSALWPTTHAVSKTVAKRDQGDTGDRSRAGRKS